MFWEEVRRREGERVIKYGKLVSKLNSTKDHEEKKIFKQKNRFYA